MQITEQQHGAVTVLSPQGPLVGVDADAFRTAAIEVMGRSRGRFVVDATGIAYVDSRGLEAILDVTERLASSGGALKVCASGETLREVLQLTEVYPMLEHFVDVNSAVRSFL
ncbi:MAG: STAS domain-containing protein [Phycisphaerales bacterium]|jgi:anti-anti-sigma factor|nr:STAS domain-containing protein [Phycisphaerales bacterium]